MRMVKELTRNMKDSGVEWIGDIPEDWEVVRIKNVSKFSNGYAFKESDLTMEGNKYVIRIGNFQDNKLIINTKTLKTNINDELLKNYKIQNGDILIAMSGATVGKIIYLKNIDEEIYINQRVGIIRSEINKLLKYYFLINGFKEHIYLNSQGSAQPNISETEILDFNISLPSKSKQQSIADFLDEKTQEIDNIISKTKKAIEEYKKYKQSLITETVTKGLDKDVEMKDSGIEWVGEIPEHWGLERLKYSFLEHKSKNIGNKEKNVLSLSYGNIVKRNIKDNFGLLPESFESYNIVKPGVIVLRLTDLQNDKKSWRVGISKQIGIITSANVSLINKAKNNR